MPLRNLEPLREWIERETPQPIAVYALALFLVDVSRQPWAYPSVPIAELSDQPSYEVRQATITVNDRPVVSVWYRHTYDTDLIDLLEVTSS